MTHSVTMNVGVRDRVDEFLILASMGALRHGQRLPMGFVSECRSTSIRNPELD